MFLFAQNTVEQFITTVLFITTDKQGYLKEFYFLGPEKITKLGDLVGAVQKAQNLSYMAKRTRSG